MYVLTKKTLTTKVNKQQSNTIGWSGRLKCGFIFFPTQILSGLHDIPSNSVGDAKGEAREMSVIRQSYYIMMLFVYFIHQCFFRQNTPVSGH